MDKLYALVFLFNCFLNLHAGAGAIGINYGLNGDNLPSPGSVKQLLQSRSISKVRIFEPNHDVLTALQGSSISIILGTRNENLQSFCSDPSSAKSWVQTNIIPYSPSIRYISAGNEVIPGELAQYLPCAMQNLDAAVKSLNLAIPVTTTVSMAIMGPSYPPSQGVFSNEVSSIMTEITTFLESRNSPLLVSVYPWFALASDPINIPLAYVLFDENAPPVTDGSLIYHNLFDAMVDSIYAALEKAGGSNVEIVVAETGWPTGGASGATVENACIYNNNLVRHVSSGQGTPRRPNRALEVYIFALFNENLKPSGVEQNWGLYYPSTIEVYHVNFPIA